MRATFTANRRHLLRARIASACVLAFLAASTLTAGPARAATVGGEHVFDPALSLTGGTGVSKIDPIPDPGETHPNEPFKHPNHLATDSHGDLYVANKGDTPSKEEEPMRKGVIDIFDPSGHFVTAIPDEEAPESIAVDSEGNIYVNDYNNYVPGGAFHGIVRYTPSSYPPVSSTTYTETVLVSVEHSYSAILAVDRANDHVFAYETGGPGGRTGIEEYGSAAEGNPFLRTVVVGEVPKAKDMAVSAATGSIFVTSEHELYTYGVDVYDMSGVLVGRIDGSELPSGEFESWLSVAVDEATGEVFVAEIYGASRVYRFVPGSGGGFEYVPDPALNTPEYFEPYGIAVANGVVPNAGDVYVNSDLKEHHVFAFVPAPEMGAPVVSVPGVSGVGQASVVLSGEVTPRGFASEYFFEYVPEEVYEQDVRALGAGHGFDGAASTAVGSVAAGASPVGVSAGVSGLGAGEAYRVRLVASNHCVKGEPEKVCVTNGEAGRFATYAGPAVQAGCPNEAVRVGVSALLGDCRGYELVSPSDTNGRPPEWALNQGPSIFPTDVVSSDGGSVLFETFGGALPGSEGNGGADGYEARRSSSGWVTAEAGMGGALSQKPWMGGASPDHEYWFWSTSKGGEGADHGSLVIEGRETRYLRLPDGSYSLLGDGALGSDPEAEGLFISPHGGHVIFSSEVPLVEGASPEGVLTIYDRPHAGEPEVISVLPDGLAPAAGAEVRYLCASADGSAVAFTVTDGGVSSLYVHRAGVGTVLVGEGVVTRAALSDDGGRLAYMSGGEAFSFDAGSGVVSSVGSGGETTVVNVSADGSRVYFVSPRVLGAHLWSTEYKPVAGKANLYVWDAGSEALTFIVTLEASDMSFEEGTYGLEYWQTRRGGGWVAPGRDTSRVSADGGTIVFESHADLTGYDAGGHVEIYRYSAGEGLSCVSCSPTLAAATGDAQLQVFSHGAYVSVFEFFAPLKESTAVANLSEDGRMVFFQTPEALVQGDVDGTDDVYEWEADGVGGCVRSGGCVSLISSGRSSGPNYLYAVTPSGSDVFFTTTDRLTASDGDPTYSIYDARIDGGFPEAAKTPCSGEECKGPLSAAPAAVSLVTETSVPSRGGGKAKGHAKHRAGKGRGCSGKHRKRSPKHRTRSHKHKRRKRAQAHKGNHKAHGHKRRAGKGARRKCGRARARRSRHHGHGGAHRRAVRVRGGAR